MDFRLITNNPQQFTQYKNDFFPVSRILEDLWEETVKYVEEKWKEFAAKEKLEVALSSKVVLV